MRNDPHRSITRQPGQPVDRDRGGRFVSPREWYAAMLEASAQTALRQQTGAPKRGRQELAIAEERVYTGQRRRATEDSEAAERRAWGWKK